MDSQALIPVTIIINPDDDQDFRDQITRDLLAQSNDWHGVAKASLPVDNSGLKKHARGDLLAVGQLAMQIVPSLFKSVVELLGRWIEANPERTTVKLKIGDREVEFPSDTSAEQLEGWCKALQVELSESSVELSESSAADK